MKDFFLVLSPAEQVGSLFAFVFGLLLILSVSLYVASLHATAQSPHTSAQQQAIATLKGLLKTTWVISVVFWLGWVSGDIVTTLLFAFVSFFALREFVTLAVTQRGDHHGLILAFFVVLPVQFILVAIKQFDLFAVFIPVYVFLAVPVLSALANDCEQFLERNAKLQWGIMVCVYGMSHVPALLLLHLPSYEGRSAFLLFYLVFCVQTGSLVQYFVSANIKRPATAPNISQSFNWTGWIFGSLAAGIMGLMLTGITPFQPMESALMAMLASAAGSFGHLVMKALKRERGHKNWGAAGLSITGASGLLYRVDTLCFAAPVFFHFVRWYLS